MEPAGFEAQKDQRVLRHRKEPWVGVHRRNRRFEGKKEIAGFEAPKEPRI